MPTMPTITSFIFISIYLQDVAKENETHDETADTYAPRYRIKGQLKCGETSPLL